MTATKGRNAMFTGLMGRVVVVGMLAAIGALALTTGTAGAQSSGGCPGGPFPGATTLDSDGDGVNDADEVRAGTDVCDPSSTPTLVCGEHVANYNPSTADTDGDGYTDADEIAAGSDPCDSESTVSPPTVEPPTVAPTLALTGPSTASTVVLFGIAMVVLGFVALAARRSIEKA